MLLEKEIKESMEDALIPQDSAGGASTEGAFKRKPDSGFEEALRMIMDQEVQRRVDK